MVIDGAAIVAEVDARAIGPLAKAYGVGVDWDGIEVCEIFGAFFVQVDVYVLVVAAFPAAVAFDLGGWPFAAPVGGKGGLRLLNELYGVASIARVARFSGCGVPVRYWLLVLAGQSPPSCFTHSI